MKYIFGTMQRAPMFLKSSSICVAFLLVVAFNLFSDSFTFYAQNMSTFLAKGKERTMLRGNAVIVSDTTKITADEIELYGEDFQYALCRKNITVEDKEKGIFLVCEDLFYDRKKKISQVKGNASMEDMKNEVVVKGGFLENRDEEEITIVQIGVRILKKNMACRSEFARYYRKDKILELSGMPVVVWKGDEYRAAKITINIDTDEIKLEGDVKGSVVSKEEKEKTKKKGNSVER